MDKTGIIQIALVEDDHEIREGLKQILNASKGLYCEHVFGDAESALAAFNDLYADVVLMDLDLPGISGLEAVRKLKPSNLDVDFIMLTVHRDSQSVFDCLKAGASGYMLKDADPVSIVNAIHEVKRGGAPMSSEVAKLVISSFHKEVNNPLTEREHEVLRFISGGADYKTIASRLFISPETVKTHTKSIYRKLHVNSKGEAISKAYKEGLI